MRELQALALFQVPSRPVSSSHHTLQQFIADYSRPKSVKYPTSYPDETEETFPLAKRELKSIRTHVRWTCDECETLFKDTEKTCSNCGHEKCDNCPRQPPQKVKRPLDEDAVKSVEERMKTLEVSPQASAA